MQSSRDCVLTRWGPAIPLAIPMPAPRHNPRREGIPAHRKGRRAGEKRERGVESNSSGCFCEKIELQGVGAPTVGKTVWNPS